MNGSNGAPALAFALAFALALPLRLAAGLAGFGAIVQKLKLVEQKPGAANGFNSESTPQRGHRRPTAGEMSTRNQL